MGLQHSAKVEVAENWRSLVGKGHVLEALQNEGYYSPCSLPSDCYDAWTELLPAATAGPRHPRAMDAEASCAGVESQKPG